MDKVLPWKAVQNRFPDYKNGDEIERLWEAAVQGIQGKIIVLDDDPTGTQTVHSIPVYTSWDRSALQQVMADDSRLVYILTNSRALSPRETQPLHRQLAADLSYIRKKTELDLLLVSRSDSTLRGHYPLETQVLHEVLSEDSPLDAEILIPFFQDGGRITIDDVHYVREGDSLIPAAQTEFARDSTFGYTSSNLKKWIEEKTEGKYPRESVVSISLDLLRGQDVSEVTRRLLHVTDFNKVIVNALEETDLKIFVRGLVGALKEGKQFLFRTAASFVRIVGGLRPEPLLKGEDLAPHGKRPSPGLVVVGSYVKKTTRQLERLQESADMVFVEWHVDRAEADQSLKAEVERVTEAVESALQAGKDACVYTSRDFYRPENKQAQQDLLFSGRVSKAIAQVVRGLSVPLGYVVAKGGITSSDVAVKGLEVKRAMVMGQILPGVPVWELGTESRLPGVPYVVFPGNVGDEEALRVTVEILRDTTR